MEPARLTPPDAEAAPRTVVVAAMAAELAGVLSGMRVTCRRRFDGCTGVWGTLGSVPVVIAWTGEGRSSARRGAGWVLGKVVAARLMVVGVSGGLSPDLTREALVVGRRVLDGCGPAPSPDPTWTENVLRMRSARAGTVVTVDHMLGTPEAKADTWSEFGRPDAAAADLETAAFAEAAAATGTPYLVVRAISDAAQDALPLDFERFRDVRGRIRRARVVGHALRHPSVIGDLLTLRSRVARCAARLARFVPAVLPGAAR